MTSRVYKDFYKNGIIELDFKSEKIDNILKSILENDIKEGYELKSKYNGTYDLRPDVISYDPSFLEVLKDNNIKKVIRDTTLKDYSLFHVQIRVVENQKSYMDWHRDTYYVAGQPVGKTPNGIKIIYYPEFEQIEERLLYLLGSNRILFPTNEYDNQLFKILSIGKVTSKKNKAILFDTNGLHSVVPEKIGKKSIRIIYNFLDRQQILDDHQGDELHMKTMNAYEELK